MLGLARANCQTASRFRYLSYFEPIRWDLDFRKSLVWSNCITSRRNFRLVVGPLKALATASWLSSSTNCGEGRNDLLRSAESDESVSLPARNKEKRSGGCGQCSSGSTSQSAAPILTVFR